MCEECDEMSQDKTEEDRKESIKRLKELLGIIGQ